MNTLFFKESYYMHKESKEDLPDLFPKNLQRRIGYLTTTYLPQNCAPQISTPKKKKLFARQK